MNTYHHHRLSRRVSAVAAAVAAMGVITGCGSSAAPSVAPTTASSGTPASGASAFAKDACAATSAAEISKAVGATVTLKTGPSGDCEFSQEDPRAISGSFGLVKYADTNGGFEGYLNGLTGVLKQPEKTSLTGLGKAASVYVGVPSFGSGANLMAGGVVDLGDVLLQVTLVQGKGLPADQLTGVAEGILRAVNTKLG